MDLHLCYLCGLLYQNGNKNMCGIFGGSFGKIFVYMILKFIVCIRSLINCSECSRC